MMQTIHIGRREKEKTVEIKREKKEGWRRIDGSPLGCREQARQMNTYLADHCPL